MKVIKYYNGEKYVNSKGVEMESYNYVLELDNGKWVVINLPFKDDRTLLSAVAIVVKKNK